MLVLMMRTTAASAAKRGAGVVVSTARQSGYPKLSFSTATAAVTEELNQQHHLFMWGTDTSGSVWKPADHVDEKMLDVPTDIVDWRIRVGGVEDSVSIRKVVCGPTDTAILTTDGRCFVSGENKQGQLGLGHANAVKAPTELTLPPLVSEDPRILDVALGSNFAAFVDGVGDLYTAGFGGSTFAGMGCLGHGDMETRHRATLVESLVEDGCTVKQVTAGESHMTVLTNEGEVLTVGSGSYGRLGNFDTIDQLYLEPVELLTADTGIVEIAGGKSFTLALSKDGVVYGWGRNHKGQLGTGLGLAVDMYAMQAVPEPIDTDELINRKVIKIAAGHSHAACITESGELFYWGMTLHLEPVRVDSVLHTKIVDVVCGQDYTLAIDENGHMYSFGKGKTGVLGQGSLRRLNQAAIMEAFEKKKIVQASAGWKHAACLVDEAA
jgi:alpha-tubulin suppressor-like RCC1 family protein